MSESHPISAVPMRVITLAGGCFWCLEAVFLRVRGVQAVESGYANGHVLQPTYAQVCDGQTGHAEVVQVRYDPSVVGLRDLLAVFFTIHDPTTLNRQGHDVGSQYRSGIYFSDAESPEDSDDRQVAQAMIAEANQAWGGAVVTELQPLRNYSKAEDYHQNYFANHPEQGYCAFVVAPKVAKFAHSFAQWDTQA